MSPSPTPHDPHPLSLDEARKAAKTLRKHLRAGDTAAITRFRAVFASRKAPEDANHADCLHVVAREAGAESWPRLKLAVETANLNREQRVQVLERAIANGNFTLMDRLLVLDPTLADAHFGIQLALANEDAAQAALASDPAAATKVIGRRWPIHHLCFSMIHQHDPARGGAMITLLDDLLAAGADVDQGFPAEPGSDHLLRPLYGALGHANNLPLAAALLERGANPNDNESLYHATELPDLDGVRLLFAHGAEIGHTNAFYRMLDRDSIEGVHLFLEHGADPNGWLYTHPGDRRADDRNALHHAIIRGRSGEIGALLIDRGVDVTARFDGRSPYALALACGNRSMADMLAARGLATELSPAEQFLAAIAADNAAAARAAVSSDPDLWQDLSELDLNRQTDLASDASNLPVLELMVDLGFDPGRKGESGMPPIHAAAWWGQADVVAFYIGLGVDLETENMFGGTALGTAVHGASHCPGRADGDYLGCVEKLVAAGARILPADGHLEMGPEEITAYLEDATPG